LSPVGNNAIDASVVLLAVERNHHVPSSKKRKIDILGAATETNRMIR